MKPLIMIGFLVSGAWAADFSHMSTQEMMNMRGNVPVDDRPAFRQEMQQRMQSMTPEERLKYKGMGKCIKGQGTRKNCCMSKQQPTFDQYDLNHDGKITPEELNDARAKRMSQKVKEGTMLRNAGNAPAFADMDKNKDGSLSQKEFRLHQTEQMNKCNKRNCPTGKCPSTSKGQGKGMMRNTRNAPTFADIDTNHDGVISKEEFRLHQTKRMQNKDNCLAGNCP